MSVRKRMWRDPETGAKKEVWMVDVVFTRADGTKLPRVRDVSPVQTRRGAEEHERQLRQSMLDGTHGQKEVPRFDTWFNGRYWTEHVVGRKNKPSTVESKRSVYRHHLEVNFGKLPLDKIGVGEIARFRASLVTKGLSDKSINNILAVLSKALHYAADVELIRKAPKVGLLKVERPEIEWWEFAEYSRIVAAARGEGPDWYAAVCLAGEAGLRIGEVRALRWREHVDLVAGTITIAEQMRHGITGTPKGGRRRVVPMTGTLVAALRALEVVREGYVVRTVDGKPMSDPRTSHAIRRILRKASLPERGWHSLRHTFGTHAALLGVNPWRLQAWMGHNRIDETMLYVHVAGSHLRPLPEPLLLAGSDFTDPDLRILRMLGARAQIRPAAQGRHTEAEANAGNKKGPNLSNG